MNSKLCKEPCPKKGRNDYDSARPDTVEPRILMVDDNSMMRETARDILRWKIPNLSFDEAGNAAEALDLIHQHLPDLILMDISLPGDSGLELTRKIKSLYHMVNNYFLGLRHGKDVMIIAGREANRDLVQITSKIMRNHSELTIKDIAGDDCG